MTPSITELLAGSAAGDGRGLDRVAPLAYGELRRLAAICLRHEWESNTLQPTGLVHELYLQMSQGPPAEWKNSSHFFASAVRSMRQVLIQRARSRHAAKRGGDYGRAAFEECEPVAQRTREENAELEAALDELGRQHPRGQCVVELRYFGGYTVEEIAAQLGVSVSTVERELRTAFAALRRHLS